MIRRGPLWHRIEQLHRKAKYPLPVMIVANPLIVAYERHQSRNVELCKTKFGRVTIAVADEFCLPRAELLGRRKTNDIVLPRQVAMHLMATIYPASDHSIAALFKRDHTCIRLAKKKVPELASKDDFFARRLGRLESAIRMAAAS